MLYVRLFLSLKPNIKFEPKAHNSLETLVYLQKSRLCSYRLRVKIELKPRFTCIFTILIDNSFLRDNWKPIVNASYNPWSPWSPCPQTCHTGNNTAIQLRNRTCLVSPGCPTSMETRPCQIQVCPGL